MLTEQQDWGRLSQSRIGSKDTEVLVTEDSLSLLKTDSNLEQERSPRNERSCKMVFLFSGADFGFCAVNTVQGNHS